MTSTGCGETQPLKLQATKNELIGAIEQKVPSLMERDEIAGLAIAFIRKGEVEFQRSFGTTDLRTGKRIDAETVFEAASLGKPVFAYLVVKLAGQGIIDLDKPLSDYESDLFNTSDPRLQDITARMVLSHTSGLPNFGSDNPQSLDFDPGSAFRYSGVGYQKLQKVIENLTGQKLETLVGRHVFEPLDMSSSSYVWRSDYGARAATGHGKDGVPFTDRKKVAAPEAAWSLYTTASDYAAFVAFNLVSVPDRDVAITAMITPETDITGQISWGLGWGLQMTKPNISFWHWGSNPGFRNYVVGYPEEQIAVVILSNSETLFKAVDEIIDIAIGGDLPSYHWF